MDKVFAYNTNILCQEMTSLIPYLFIPIQSGEGDPAGGAGAVPVGAHGGAADGGDGGGGRRAGERGHAIVEVHDAAVRRLEGGHNYIWSRKGPTLGEFWLVQGNLLAYTGVG